MKKICSIFIMVMLSVMAVTGLSAAQLPDETLHYRVLYKWGPVNKTAGRATLRLKGTTDKYYATLVARTEPWADKIYHLRDTLRSTMHKSNLVPIRYDKIAHEDGKFSHDIVKFTRSGNTFTGNCTRYRRKAPGSALTTSKTNLSAQGMTVDMLSVFYYIRTIDFQSLPKGNTRRINIFSGKKKETLTIVYHGTQSVSVGGKNCQAYLVTFTFTTGGKKSSEPIKSWVSADSRRIPLKLEGTLPIGKVVCELTGS